MLFRSLTATPAAQDMLETFGEFASGIADPFGNIVAKALNTLPHGPGWSVRLEKRLPVAAGLGGGSADAAAVFRMVEQAQGLPDDWMQRAAKLGADVPACILSRACIGTGTGTEIEVVANDLAGTPVLLVNPRAPMQTGPVFQGWDGTDRGPMPSGSLRSIAIEGRNDLEAPAIALCPIIADVLAALQAHEPIIARMSGSGATCFALYDSVEQRDAAAKALSVAQPDWWQLAGALR